MAHQQSKLLMTLALSLTSGTDPRRLRPLVLQQPHWPQQAAGFHVLVIKFAALKSGGGCPDIHRGITSVLIFIGSSRFSNLLAHGVISFCSYWCPMVAAE